LRGSLGRPVPARFRRIANRGAMLVEQRRGAHYACPLAIELQRRPHGFASALLCPRHRHESKRINAEPLTGDSGRRPPKPVCVRWPL